MFEYGFAPLVFGTTGMYHCILFIWGWENGVFHNSIITVEKVLNALILLIIPLNAFHSDIKKKLPQSIRQSINPGNIVICIQF